MRSPAAVPLAVFLLAACFTSSARAADPNRLWVLSGPKQLKRVSLADPTQVAQTLDLSATVTAFSIENDYALQSIARDPDSGDFYGLAVVHLFLGDLALTVRVTHDTGEVEVVNSHAPAPGAVLRVHPVTGAVHLVEGAVDTALGVTNGGETPFPSIAFAVGDANAGASFSCVGLAFQDSNPSATTSTAFALDATTDSLCRVDLDAGVATTVGPLGVDLPIGVPVAGPVIDADGSCRFVADLGLGKLEWSVDLASGAIIGFDSFPPFGSPLDLALEVSDTIVVDFDEDGWPTRIENAVGSDPLDAESTPFPGFEVPDAAAAPALCSRLVIRLDFARVSRDKLTLVGRLPLASPVERAGATFLFDVDGKLITFETNSKGRGKLGRSRLVIDKKSGGEGHRFRLDLDRADLGADLADAGLTDADASEVPLTVDLAVWRAGALDVVSVPVTWTASAGAKGRAKSNSAGP